MPQLNPEFYLSQIFWLVVTFTFLLFFLWKVSLPRIRNAIEIRNNKISNDLEIAKKSQENGEKIQAEIDNALAAANNKAQSKINDTISPTDRTNVLNIVASKNYSSKVFCIQIKSC